jgi:hypothetical protein
MSETMFFFSVQVCLDPWTVLRQADLQRYLFWGGKGMFLCFYVKKMCLWTPSKSCGRQLYDDEGVIAARPSAQ